MSVRVVIVSVVLALALGLAPAGASATSQDVASTHAYLTASYRALSFAVSTWSSRVEASIHRLQQKLNAECPKIGAGSPQNEEEQKLASEVAGALWATGYRSDAATIRQYVATLNRLSWSKPQITRDARRLAKGLQEMLALQVPDICADVRAWRSGGFGALPAGVGPYAEHAAGIEIHEIPRSLLVPYVQASDRSLRTRAEQAETKFEELEFVRGQDDWLALLKTVGLNG